MAAESEESLGDKVRQAEEVLHQARYDYLLAALIVLICIYPFDDDSFLSDLFFGFLDSVILLAAAFAASRSRRSLLFASLFVAPMVALLWLHTINRDKLSGDLLLLVVALFYGFTIFRVFSDVLRPGVVTQQKICGAISVYILAACMWASLYSLVESLLPGSFAISERPDLGTTLEWKDFIFFSFTTLTSTGYGDIVPLGRHAQSLTILQQLAGVFYVAILIARLAGLYQPRAAGKSKRPG